MGRASGIGKTELEFDVEEDMLLIARVEPIAALRPTRSIGGRIVCDEDEQVAVVYNQVVLAAEAVDR